MNVEITKHAEKRYFQRYGGTPEDLRNLVTSITPIVWNHKFPYWIERNMERGKRHSHEFKWRGVRLVFKVNPNKSYILVTVLPEVRTR